MEVTDPAESAQNFAEEICLLPEEERIEIIDVFLENLDVETRALLAESFRT